MKDLIVQSFDNIIKREIAEADEVREEIKRRGTYWAGDEIWKLRRQVAALRKRLSEHEGVVHSHRRWTEAPRPILIPSATLPEEGRRDRSPRPRSGAVHLASRCPLR